MKKNYYYSAKIAIFMLAMLLVGCSQESIEKEMQPLNVEQQDHPLGNMAVEILPVKDSNGEITGYFYVDQPSEIYAIPQDFEPEKFKSSSVSNELVDLVGDRDGFGYNSTSPPPCDRYDLSEEEDRIGNFDRVIDGPSDEVKNWTHDFSDEFCSTYIIEEVSLEIREYFNNGDVTVIIDGTEFNLVQNGLISKCSGRNSIQTFTFSGGDAAFAQDGLVDVSILENGDAIAIDYSLLRVSYSIPLSESSEIIIGGCNTGVANELVNCDYLSKKIDDLILKSDKHGAFISSLAHLTNAWIGEGLISASEKEAIMSCAAKSKLF